jgi:hypothetical protein
VLAQEPWTVNGGRMHLRATEVARTPLEADSASEEPIDSRLHHDYRRAA